MKKVYVAGAYSANNIIDVLGNIRLGIRTSTEVFLAGFAPFCPWLDFQYQLMLRDGEMLDVEDYYKYSMSWLEVSDYILVLPNWETSKGTKAEIKRAKELNIPIFYNLEELKKKEQLFISYSRSDRVEKGI